MTLVEHLDELRNRIIVSAAVLVVACGLCFWQNHLLLHIANQPLPGGVQADHARRHRAVHDDAEALDLRRDPDLPAGAALPGIRVPAARVEADREARRAAVPAAGPGAVHDGRGVLVLRGRPGGTQVPARTSTRASSTSRCGRASTTASSSSPWPRSGSSSRCRWGSWRVTRLGIVTPEQLSHNRRYAYLILAVVAMLLPGNRSRHHADRAGAALGPVRVLADPGADTGHAGRAAASLSAGARAARKPRRLGSERALRPSRQAQAARPGGLHLAGGDLPGRLRGPGDRRRQLARRHPRRSRAGLKQQQRLVDFAVRRSDRQCQPAAGQEPEGRQCAREAVAQRVPEGQGWDNARTPPRVRRA